MICLFQCYTTFKLHPFFSFLSVRCHYTATKQWFQQATLGCDHNPGGAGRGRAQQLPLVAQEPGQAAGGGGHHPDPLREELGVLEAVVEGHREKVGC